MKINQTNYNRIKRLCLLILLFNSAKVHSQKYNHTWLIGYHYQASSILARMNFDSSGYVYNTEQRKMDFAGTQGNISDSNGNFLISSNGVWIANSINDTMQNGTDLNPAWLTTNWHNEGLPIPYGNLIIPMPDDSLKYILFHQTSGPIGIPSTEIYYSIIDKSLDSGKGAVISKNNILLNGSFGWGLSACKHANGRDWWLVFLSDNSNSIYKVLVTPDTIVNAGVQSFTLPSVVDFAGQPTFSPDGSKFAYASTQSISLNYWYHDLKLFDFDRCSGNFTLNSYIDLNDSIGGYGLAFSPNSDFLYTSSWQKIYQLYLDTNNVAATIQTVAINDTFLSAAQSYTDFFLMYLAANGKIYLTSGGSVQHLHEMDYPDSSGVACNVNLHNILLNCLHFRTVPNHPNYYLGRKIGSPCDSLTSITEIERDFRFSISPNPSNGNFKIIYLLPQNKKGTLQIFDITGKEIYKQNLPQWSTLQNISIPHLASGVYAVKINADNYSVTKKLFVQQE